MKRVVLIMSFFSMFFGGCKKEPLASGVPLAATGKLKPGPCSIRVNRGTADAIKDAIIDHATLFKAKAAQEFRVLIVSLDQGGHLVLFPDGLPPYELVNLIGWLNHPPEMPSVSGATGWITSPGSGERYFLQPEAQNADGDTLIGCSPTQGAIQVYLPEATMCRISRTVASVPEPGIGVAARPVLEFDVRVDVDASCGNPEFKLTHPEETDWNQ